MWGLIQGFVAGLTCFPCQLCENVQFALMVVASSFAGDDKYLIFKYLH